MPTEAEVYAALDNVSKKNIEAYVDEVSDEPLLPKIPSAAPLKSEKTIDEIGVTELTLANGVKVVLKHTDFKNDEVNMAAYSKGGHSLYSDEDYKHANSAASIVNQAGLGTFDNTQLQKKLTGKKVRVSPFIGELYEGFRGNASPDDIETMMQMIYLYFTAPRQDEDVLQSYVTKQKSIFSNLLSNPQYYFFDQVGRILSSNHPRSGFPTGEMMDAIRLEPAMKIYKDRFADASDFTFFFVGNFDMDQMKKLSETYLANLPTTGRKETWKDLGVKPPVGKVEKRLVKGEAPKALVNMTFHGDFEWTGQNRYDFYSTLDVLRIKMRESMREDKGGVYGVRVSGNVEQFPSKKYSITVSFNADPPMVDELIATALLDIENAKKTGAADKDLTKVKETQRQGRIKDLKENRFWMRQLQAYYKNGSDPSKLTQKNYEAYVNGLNSDAVKTAANKYFDMNSFVSIVMLPEESEE